MEQYFQVFVKAVYMYVYIMPILRDTKTEKGGWGTSPHTPPPLQPQLFWVYNKMLCMCMGQNFFGHGWNILSFVKWCDGGTKLCAGSFCCNISCSTHYWQLNSLFGRSASGCSPCCFWCSGCSFRYEAVHVYESLCVDNSPGIDVNSVDRNKMLLLPLEYACLSGKEHSITIHR